MRAHHFALCIVVAAASQLGASDCGSPPIITDPGFDLWCGDSLCAWKIDRGDVAKAGTWHSEDAGVSLLGNDTAISQLSQTSATCIEFSFIADIDPQVEVRLEADVFADGAYEYCERMPTARWLPLTYRMRFAKAPDGVRFRFSKRGDGAAVLAQLEAKAVSDCQGLPAITVTKRPLGASCLLNTDCTSSYCVASPDGWGVCSGCPEPGQATGCRAPQICTSSDPFLPIQGGFFECDDPGARELGERCETNNECSTGSCTDKRCSTCGGSQQCSNGETCASAKPGRTPYLCALNQQQRTAGEPCFSNADCTSLVCNGAEQQQCPDGRACTTTADCPSEGSAQHGACVPVGVQGGTCS